MVPASICWHQGIKFERVYACNDRKKCNFAPSLTSNLYCFMRTKSIETNDYKDVTNYMLWKILF